MIDLQQISKKYQKTKKHIENQKLYIKQRIQQQIQLETINALKIQNHKVSEIHKNQHNIEVKLKRNNQIKIQMEKQISLWNQMYEQLNKSLKKAGDLAHYANFIEDQVNQVCFQINPVNQNQIYQSCLKNLDD